MRGFTITFTKFRDDKPADSRRVRFLQPGWFLLAAFLWVAWKRRHSYPRVFRNGALVRVTPDPRRQQLRAMAFTGLTGVREIVRNERRHHGHVTGEGPADQAEVRLRA